MKGARKRPAAANPRSWRVIIIRSRGEYLGSVEAPDRQRAEAAAIKHFDLDQDQRGRLLILERPQMGWLRLILKRASASPPSGEWDADDFDVAADGAVVGQRSQAPHRLQAAPETRRLSRYHRANACEAQDDTPQNLPAHSE